MKASNAALNREVLLSLWKIHILHHAAEGPVVGQWMLRELRRHGYDLSPGTLYPLLQRLTRRGWLRCRVDKPGGPRAIRRYFLTPEGKQVLALLRSRIDELQRELKEHTALKQTRHERP